jgi:RIB43A
MLKSLLSTGSDLKEAAIIEKRRNAEEDRKRRFFDAKQRILGIDCNELDRQLLEKEQAYQAEKELSRIEAEEMKKNLEIAEARENELREQKRQSEIELNEYRKMCQQPKDTNDFDLYDPHGKKKSLPARLDDNDPRLSKSGGQLFLGEDLSHHNRIREQKVLQKQWLDQQIAERKNLEMNQKKSERLMHESISQHDIYSVSQSDRLTMEKRDLQRQIRQYNEALADQKRENEKKRKEMEQQDNLAEIYNFLSSDLLKENQPKGSNLGPNRVIPYAYKHMTDEQIEKLQKEQEMQKADIYRKKLDEKQQKNQWNQLTEDNFREMTLKERALSRNIRQMNHSLREENEELAKQQKYKIEHFEKVINTNPPTEEFFQQFNTTSR